MNYLFKIDLIEYILNSEFNSTGMLTSVRFVRSWRGDAPWLPSVKVRRELLGALLVATAFVAFYSTLFRYAVNIPISDDYHATLQFLLRYEANPGSLYNLLLEQHNEHRIVVSRLLALAQYKLAGEVNFRHLLLLQSLFLLGLLAALIKLGQTVGLRWSNRRLAPIMFMLFSLNAWETYLFVSGGSQSYPALLGMTLALLCLNQAVQAPPQQRLGWTGAAALCGLWAMFAFGAGLLVWPAGLLLLLLQRQGRLAGLWGGLAVGMALLYLHQYRSTHLSADLIGSLREQGGVFVRFALSFPGVSFQVPWTEPLLWRGNVLVCYGVGLLSWLYFGYLTLSGYARRQPLLYTYVAMFFAVDLLIAFSRCRVGGNTAFNSRYQILSAMITVGLCMTLYYPETPLRQTVRQWVMLGVTALLLVVFGLSVPFQSEALAAQHRQKVDGMQRWLTRQEPSLFILPDYQTSAGQLLLHCRARIYWPAPDVVGRRALLIADSVHRCTSPSAPALPASRR